MYIKYKNIYIYHVYIEFSFSIYFCFTEFFFFQYIAIFFSFVFICFTAKTQIHFVLNFAFFMCNTFLNPADFYLFLVFFFNTDLDKFKQILSDCMMIKLNKNFVFIFIPIPVAILRFSAFVQPTFRRIDLD